MPVGQALLSVLPRSLRLAEGTRLRHAPARIPIPPITPQTLIYAALVVACAVVFAFATAAGVQSIREAQSRRQLQELATSTLHRAELAADYAFIALAELSERSDIVCSGETLSLFRAQIHQRAIVKDIRIVDAGGGTLCSAFPEAFAATDTRLDLATALVSRNGQIRLLPLMLDAQPAFGVLWALEPGTHLLAVVNTGTLVYDVLPNALRDGNEARVVLSDGTAIASYRGATAQAPDASLTRFSAASARYPLRSEIHIGQSQLAAWNGRVNPAYPLGGGVLGLVFGLLAVRAMTGSRSVTADLDRALANGEFRAYAQPIFSLRDGAVTGCEILARQVSRDGTVLAPQTFIPLAEQTGRIAPITWQIIDDALTRMRPFLSRNKLFTVAFNIDAAHLMQPSFATELRAHVLGARVATRQVVLELTERRQIDDLEAVADTIARLKQRGYRFAIDDAGTGHSGLSYIQKLGARVIKIDKLFVDSVVDDPSARSLIKMLVRLAGDLGMSTVAEGIETPDQWLALAELGVDRGQGYLVSKPLPLDAFLRFVERTEGTEEKAKAA